VSSISAVAFQQHRPLLYHRKGGAHLLAHSKNCRATDDDGERRNTGDQDGSIAGASLLFAGTAVGAGMIALPAETINAGYAPSIFGLSVCWLFTYVTSILTLEASWLAFMRKEGKSGDGVGFLSTSKMSLGVPGEVITAVFFWFLLTAIVVAYTAEGGKLIAQIANEATNAFDVSPALGSLLFTSFFASIAIDGTSRVDIINRLFVFGLVSTFIGIVASITPFVETANLVDQSDWSGLYPSVISIGILSFGAQNTVPTILQYLNYDPERAKKAILFGSLIPLLLYTIWETVFLGVINPSTLDSTNMEVVNVLGQIGGTTITDLVEIFSICAIGSSMAGASVSLVDFFVDAIGLMSNEEPKAISEQTIQGSRVIAAALALGPPLLISYAFSDVFLTALEEAGLLGGVSLYGLLPALCLLSLRSNDGSSQIESMTGRLGGGNITLFAIIAISAALILPEIAHVLD
jgi:tyrosine-specific transport protein